MKKVFFASIVIILAMFAFFLVPSYTGNVVTPYQEADSQLLIPQRNVVIATIDLYNSNISFFDGETIELLENLNNE